MISTKLSHYSEIESVEISRWHTLFDKIQQTVVINYTNYIF